MGSLVYYLHDQNWLECQISSRTHDSLVLSTRDNDGSPSSSSSSGVYNNFRGSQQQIFECCVGSEDEGIEGNS